MKEVIYTRQSIDKKDGVSIETQIEVCRKISPEAQVYTDKGYSGKNTERPELQRLIEEIKLGQVSKVVVYRLDRISRNIIDFYTLYETMQEHDCSFQSASEAFDTSTTIGRAMMGILAVFAQMERENIQQRVKDSYYNRIQDGRWSGGPAPFGYVNGKNEYGTSTLIPDENLEAVKLAFDMYASSVNISLSQIADELRNRGYTSKSIINVSTISRLLRNPIYAVADKVLYKYYKSLNLNFTNPEQCWNGSTSANIIGKHKSDKSKTTLADLAEQTIYLSNIKGIIGSRTFIMVQNRLAENVSFGSSNSPKTRLKELAGLLKCGNCGYAVKMKADYPSLVCDGRTRLKCCDWSFRGIRLEALQEQVSVEMQNKLDGVEKLFKKQKNKKIRLRSKITALEKEINNLIETIATAPSVSSRLTDAITARQAEINKIQLELQTENYDDIIQLRLNLIAGTSAPIQYMLMNTEQKQMLCKMFIERINLFEGGKMEVVWKDL